ncbi:major capsid protein, partial [Enterobacter hormaechei]
IKHTEKVIHIDGLLTADVLIYDIEDAMNHYDVRAEYTAQLGESLAMAADGAVLAELAGLVNLPDASNANIDGLGNPTALTLLNPKAGDLTVPV